MGTLGAVLTAYFFDTAEKDGGKGSSRASFANEEGDHKRYGLYQGSYGVFGHQQSLFIPGASTSAGYTRSLTSSAAKWSSTIPRLYQVINDPLFIPGRSKLFTPVTAVWGALLRPVHSRGALSGPLACVAPGRERSTPLGRFWAVSFLQSSSLQYFQNGRGPFRTV